MRIPMNFICARHEFNTPERYVPQPYFRRSFEVKGGLVCAELIIGSLGYYEVHINGRDITKGEMAPYRSNPDHYVYFDKYDIISLLSEGKNVLASLLGNGLQNTVTKTWGGTRFPWRSAPALSFEIGLKYADGSEEKIVSDEHTLCCDSPIIFNDFHYGEYYDARLEIKDWDTVDFDDSSWNKSIQRKAPRGKAKLCGVEPIRIIDEIKPVSITEYDGGYIYDFGVNEAGLCRMNIKNGQPGQKIRTAHFETLVDGKPHFRNIRFADNAPMQEDEYICAGGDAVHTPKFTYHGFQYVLVTGITSEQATPELLTYLTIHSDLKKRGYFTCDNEIINKIQEATVRSDLSNFHYLPTDCPQREKNGWTADAALSAEQMLVNIEPENSWKDWLRNIYKAMDESGIVPGIIPTGDWGYDDYNGPCWDCVIVWLPYYTYKYRGDIEFLKEAATPILRYINRLYNMIDDRNLIEHPSGMGDWAQVGRPSGRAFRTPTVVTDSIISYDIAQKSAFIFDELGLHEYAYVARALEKRLYEGIRTHLIDLESGKVHGETQTAQSMAIYYGLVDGEEKKKVLDHLITVIGWDKEHMNVGVHGGRVLFRVLCDNGYAELAYNMIARTDYPSYGNWIARGATTLWEFFDADGCGKIDSLNHHFWGDVSAWFFRYLAGMDINPCAGDINHVNVAPIFISELNRVEAEHILPSGTLHVEWERTNGSITLSISCPESLHGEIRLPDGWHFEGGNTVIALKNGSFTIAV